MTTPATFPITSSCALPGVCLSLRLPNSLRIWRARAALRLKAAHLFALAAIRATLLLSWNAGYESDGNRSKVCDAMNKSPGQIAYEQELLVRPNYHDGMPRKSWHSLPDYAQVSWEKNPTPRYGNVDVQAAVQIPAVTRDA